MAPTMKGVQFSAADKKLKTEIKDFEIPKPGKSEVLIKNVAVASNPKDWKMPLLMHDKAPIIEGNDVAGYIEAVGSDVKEFKKGDKVGAFSTMKEPWGAYAEYTIAPSHTTWQLAENTSFEDAATLPLAMMTAQIGLFKRLGLTPPPTDGSFAKSRDQVVIINGASSSVGAFATQLAKRAGYVVVGIAGQSGSLVTELGADDVLDYRSKSDEDLIEEVKSAVQKRGKLAGTYDAVSTATTVGWLAQVVSSLGGGEITTVLPHPDDLKIPDGVTIDRTMVGTAHKEDSNFAAEWYRRIGKWLDDGSFKANEVKIVPGGLDGVSEGMKLLQDNKVNGVKLVYRIKDSKCLQ